MAQKYEAGQRFRVVREGARFEGLLLFGEQSVSGWSRRITKGEILTCLGWKTAHVFGTQVTGVMWTGAKVPDNAMTMQIWPFESLFRPQPLPGLLEPYVEPETFEDKIVDSMSQPLEEAIDDGHVVDLTQHLPVLDLPAIDEGDDGVVDLTGF